jgi:hypothetical protein
MSFKDFCESFIHINGCDKEETNCMSVYYNLQLVLSKYRLSFLIQPIDYKYSNDYSALISNLLYYYDNIDTKCHPQGTLVFLKENLEMINNILDTSTTKNDSTTLGLVLSYPYYDHEWTNHFITLYVHDIYGNHTLLSNWYNDDGHLFESNMKEWINYLMEHHHCEPYVIREIV